SARRLEPAIRSEPAAAVSFMRSSLPRGEADQKVRKLSPTVRVEASADSARAVGCVSSSVRAVLDEPYAGGQEGCQRGERQDASDIDGEWDCRIHPMAPFSERQWRGSGLLVPPMATPGVSRIGRRPLVGSDSVLASNLPRHIV